MRLHAFLVTDMAAWQSLLRLIEKEFGQLDVVINNAGITHRASTVHDMPNQVMRNIMEVNFFGMVNGTQAC